MDDEYDQCFEFLSRNRESSQFKQGKYKDIEGFPVLFLSRNRGTSVLKKPRRSGHGDRRFVSISESRDLSFEVH